MPDTIERRRSFRFKPKDLKGSIQLDQRTQPLPKVVDISTLGIGIELDEPPKDPKVHFTFDAPNALKGLRLNAQQKRVKKIDQSDSHTRYLIGYEFVFLNVDQEHQLHRWTTEYLHLQKPEPTIPVPAKRPHPFMILPAPGSKPVWDIRFPRNKDEYEQCVNLLLSPVVQHALVQTKYFVVLEKGSAASIVVLMPDLVDFKLKADKKFPQELDALRGRGRRLAEITIPFFNESHFKGRNPSSVHLRKIQILFALFPHIVTYSARFAGLTDLVILSPIHLEEFFRMWLFEDLAVIGDDPEKAKARYPKPMILNLDRFYQIAEEKRRELFTSVHALEMSDAAKHTFKDSYFPDEEILKKWFVETMPVLRNLNTAQKSYFRSFAPNLFA